MPRRISFLTMSGAGPISSPVVRYSLLSRWAMLVFPQCLGQPVTHQMGRGRFQRMGHQPRIYLPEFNGHLVRLLVERYQPTLWPLQNSHYFEATLAYCFSDSFPLSLSWSTMFAGADKNEKGNLQASTYLSASYPFRLPADIVLTPAVGFTPWKGMYHHKAAFTDVSLKVSKEVSLSNHLAIPLSVQAIVSPVYDRTYLVAGIGIGF